MIEMVIVIAILGILSAAAIPLYTGYVERSRVYAAMEELSGMSTTIQNMGMETGVYPRTLAEAGYGAAVDPWGNPYQYLNIANAGGGVPGARKDRFLVPINSDFDLYSKGKDGNSMPALTAKASKDDVIRANDGLYIGIAEGF